MYQKKGLEKITKFMNKNMGEKAIRLQEQKFQKKKQFKNFLANSQEVMFTHVRLFN